MTTPYGYQLIRTSTNNQHYRIHDGADNAVAHCFLEENAHLVTEALNYMHGLPVHWSCGHVAGAHCATCHQELSRKATELREQLDVAVEKLTEVGGR
jgi:hypothetical protein